MDTPLTTKGITLDKNDFPPLRDLWPLVAIYQGIFFGGIGVPLGGENFTRPPLYDLHICIISFC